MGVSVLVPYRPGEPWHDRAWQHVAQRWARTGLELIVESPGPGAHTGEFNHPLAINNARRRASGDVLIVADADTAWAPDDWVHWAVEAVERGEAAWALPAEYWQLSPAQSEDVLAGGAVPEQREWADAEWVGRGVSWSGVVVVSADAFDEVGGYDERWAWWGSDDAAFAAAMTTLVGPVLRLPGRCLHFWHPRPVANYYGHAHHHEQHALQERYDAAMGDPAAMRAVRFT